VNTTSYSEFIRRKSQLGGNDGFEPVWMPDALFPFQRHLVEWAVRKGRAAIFADCGLGKSAMEMAWAENVARKTGRPVLMLTPLAVAAPMVAEGRKFGVEAHHSRDASRPAGARVVVTNYERLRHFSADDFAGAVCDESSILKNHSGSTRRRVTRFLSKMRYRLLATATPSPNDHAELGTSAEALGELTNSDMLRRFFAYCDDKKQRREADLQRRAEAAVASDPNYYRKLAYRVAQTIGQWRLKHHAVVPFWRWVSSWARACRKPSDLGDFDDTPFALPPLEVNDHVIAAPLPPGEMFPRPAVGLYEEKQERRRTLAERCDHVAALVDHDRPAAVWCQMDEEADRLASIIPGAEQIAGRTPEARRLELYDAFGSGRLRVLVIKPKIGAWGLNWQHCAHVVTFVTHSTSS
jgi:superfamily II DNA or RNA helicase